MEKIQKTKSFDILTFGSVTFDIILHIPDMYSIQVSNQKEIQNFFALSAGAKIPVKNSLHLCGGGSANSSVGFSKLGLKTAIFGIIGSGSNSKSILHELIKNKVCTNYLTTAKGMNSSFSIILNSFNGERTVFHQKTTSKHFNKKILDTAPNARCIYTCHLAEESEDILFAIPKWKQKNPNSFWGWNPGKTQFKKGINYFSEILSKVDILILNVEEAEMFTNINSLKITQNNQNDYDSSLFGKKIEVNSVDQVNYLSDVRTIADTFLTMGIKKVVITDGERGAQLFDGKNHLYSPSQSTKRLDTLGAGDAFSVGIITAILSNASIFEQISWGNHNANGVIQKYGAQAGQLTLKEMQKLINNKKEIVK